ncbi:hypothetical protein H6G00_05185 [Leptolyngbya sp. FACHB-541]|uniref:hypothetical protein n=1 Tax=Leptolyngbya sp. FACHB-541 TaxID=2692810 RepID=UPI001687B652|nr:hypothetical protein [Leptolyngbya sp. FACHB-541]MBD1996010.1 hypothetical protein [Leptolyngbya sp. FACHB-541]
MNQEQLCQELSELEEKLKTILKDELGTFNNGHPAIWKGNIIPTGLKTTGLQCKIQAVPKGPTYPMSAGQIFADHSWVVILENFDSRSPALAIAKFKIEQAFVLKKEAEYQAPTELRLGDCKLKCVKGQKLRSNELLNQR